MKQKILDAYVPGPVGNEVESVDEIALLLEPSK